MATPIPQFGFAYIDPDEVFGSEHFREDEFIYEATIEEREANFASLRILVENPGVGLLSTGRKTWCMFSVDEGLGDGPELLFKGRCVGSPSDLFEGLIEIMFVAQPLDYAQVKQDLARTLKVAKFWAPELMDIAKRDDPDAIIKAYSAFYHTDRRTHEVTISDYLIGSTLVEFGADQIFFEGLKLHLGSPPKTALSYDVSVSWANASTGQITFGPYTVETYTGQSLKNQIPKEGANLGGGWSVVSSTAREVWPVENAPTFTFKEQYTNHMAHHEHGDTMNKSFNQTGVILAGSGHIEQQLTLAIQVGLINPFPDTKDVQPATHKETGMVIPKWKVEFGMVARYEAGRDRQERLRVTLKSDVQAIKDDGAITSTVVSEDPPVVIDGGDVGAPVLQNDFLTGEALAALPPPIGDPSKNNFWSTEHGLEDIAYVLGLMRSELLLSARAVELTWPTTFHDAKNLTCAGSTRIADPRIPGGAEGKIIAIEINITGGDASSPGEMTATVTSASAIGNAGHPVTATGEGSYAAPGYMAPGYQYMIGAQQEAATSDLVFEPPTAAVADGYIFPLTYEQVIVRDSIVGSTTAQLAAINAALPAIIQQAQAAENPTMAMQIDTGTAAVVNINDVLKNASVWWDFALRSVDKESLSAAFIVPPPLLHIPKQIDLASVGV